MTAVLETMVDSVRRQVRDDDPAAVAADVSGAIRPFLAAPDLLEPGQCTGDAASYVQHVLHVAPDGAFSVVALVWLPGQRTPVHDHVAWCVTGVYRGVEQEQRYAARGGTHLVPTEQVVNRAGEVCGFAPPGDIHLVRNAGDEKAISIHVYGADIGALGSSVRRTYELPIRG